jgi:hypothetical protein
MSSLRSPVQKLIEILSPINDGSYQEKLWAVTSKVIGNTPQKFVRPGLSIEFSRDPKSPPGNPYYLLSVTAGLEKATVRIDKTGSVQMLDPSDKSEFAMASKLNKAATRANTILNREKEEQAAIKAAAAEALAKRIEAERSKTMQKMLKAFCEQNGLAPPERADEILPILVSQAYKKGYRLEAIVQTEDRKRVGISIGSDIDGSIQLIMRIEGKEYIVRLTAQEPAEVEKLNMVLDKLSGAEFTMPAAQTAPKAASVPRMRG